MLLQRFLEILVVAEGHFGQRGAKHQILEVLFHGAGPGLHYPEPGKVRVYLSDMWRSDESMSAYQMAHEAVHCLDPVPVDIVTVLEEGVATWFQTNFVASRYGHKCTSGDLRYDTASAIVGGLLASRPDSLRHLRSKLGLSPLRAADLQAEFPELSAEHAQWLATPFQAWAGPATRFTQ